MFTCLQCSYVPAENIDKNCVHIIVKRVCVCMNVCMRVRVYICVSVCVCLCESMHVCVCWRTFLIVITETYTLKMHITLRISFSLKI